MSSIGNQFPQRPIFTPEFRGVPAYVADIGAALDAFGRKRVSEPYTLFDAKQIVDNLPLLFDDTQISGSGTTSTYSKARASSTLAVSANTAGRRVRQSKRRMNYQPGKSLLVIVTAIMGQGTSGITKRAGYFDDNNGLFFELRGTTLGFVVRSGVSGSPVDTFIPQSQWNVNRLNSADWGQTLDITKAEIFFIDLEWLGVGAVRFGFVIDKQVYLVHQVNNANNLDAVYMSTPNLPIRYELINSGSGAAATMETICSTVISEGGSELTGIDRTFGRGITALTGVTNTWAPVLSWRLKSTHFEITTIPQAFSVMSPTTAFYEYGLFLNPTIAGVDSASWASLANSAIEYDISRTVANVVSGGYEMLGGYGSSASSLSSVVIPTQLIIGATYAGVADQLVLAVRTTSPANPTESFLAKVTIRELI